MGAEDALEHIIVGSDSLFQAGFQNVYVRGNELNEVVSRVPKVNEKLQLRLNNLLRVVGE
ncbi:hypothetical protein IEQ34_000595 [Dendrobium chrysotoxum]|uniref:Uncharacterized protein n=1 Tax=Dendrobium chrysotoxum TaxID=161865 RepID=A0AAV7HQV6_DENCH|nr:hypothetical protein IEQ34_000595 [Dendrobium chrysotoxum]